MLQPSQYQGLIERRLRAFAEKISAAAENVRWYIEFRPSSRYRLTGELVFADAEERDAELVVVGVRLDGERGWVFDVMDQRRKVRAVEALSGSADSTAVMNTFSGFLDKVDSVVSWLLRWEAEKPPLAERLSRFERMWTTDAHRYVLSGGLIIDVSGDGEFAELAVLIEDDEVGEAVKERMLRAGVPVRE